MIDPTRFELADRPRGKPVLQKMLRKLARNLSAKPDGEWTVGDLASVQRAQDLAGRVISLEFLAFTLPNGDTEFSLQSTCCSTTVKQVPADPNSIVACATCGFPHGFAGEVSALGAWLVLERSRARAKRESAWCAATE